MRSTWDLFQEMDALRQEVDRVFRDAGLSGFMAPSRRFAFLPGRGARAYPLVNVSEDANAFYADALAPGLDPKTLEVNVVRDQVSIRGEKHGLPSEVKAEAYHRVERAAGRFVRTFALPTEVDASKVQAEYKNGILKLTLPKDESAKPKQIAVSVA